MKQGFIENHKIGVHIFPLLLRPMCDNFFKPAKEQTSTMLFIKDRATEPESFGDKTGAIE